MMGITKRCGLFVAFFVLSLIGLSAGYSDNVSAASDYDYTWHSVSPLSLEREGWGSCSGEDMSLNWSEIITNSDNWIGDKSAAKTSFENAIANGRWGVSQARYKSGSNFEKSIWVFWTEDTGLALSWDLVGGRHQATPVSETSSDVHAAQIFQNSSCEPKFQSYYVGAGFSHASDEDWPLNLDGSSVANFFFYSDRLNLPAGYAGETIKQSGSPQVEPDEFLYPQYEWKIANKKLNVKYLGNIPHFLTGINTIVIEKWAFNWETGTNEIIETILENPAGWTNSTYDLTTDGAGYYTVRITHNQQLDSPPWEEDANELYYIAPIFIRINWDGSSNRAGTTAGCAERNAVCGDVKEGEGNQSNPLYGMFNALSNLELHGLTNFLLAPINFIGTLPSKVSSCTPISYPLFGTTQTLPCLRPMYEQYAVIYGLWQTIINGVVIGLVSMNLFRVVKNINTPTQDGIEVARL